jgi:hypothetical protein
MNTDLHERLRALGDFAISESPPVERIAGRGRQIQRRRRAVTAALVVLLVVGTVAGLTAVLDRGDSRNGIVSSHKELGRELRYLSGYVVPNDGSAATFTRAERALEHSAVVEQYVIMPPGWASVHLATDQCRETACVPSSRDRLPLACAALDTRSFAVQLTRTPSAATRLRDALGGDGRLYTTDDLGDVDVYLDVKATSASATRLRTAIARDDDLASYRFFDHAAAYREFKNIERNNPALLASVEASDLPESFLLYLRTTASPATVEHRYQSLPGVNEVVSPAQPLNGPFDDAYLQWLRGTNRPGTSLPTAQLPFGDPAVDPCDRSH